MELEVRKIIEEHADLIESNKWEEIYSKLKNSMFTGKFTKAILDANIDPLDYLDYIPKSYLSRVDIKEFTIPNHIIKIGRYSFAGSGIENITIPNSVIEIGPYAFNATYNLKNIIIPKSVKNIEYGAFENSGVENIIFEESSELYWIEAMAFSGAVNLKSIIIPRSVEGIGAHAFDRTGRLKIYAEVESKPEYWSEYWKPTRKPVIWGYKK